MKAPDKIYIQTNAGEAFSSKWTTIPFRDFENTEYVRKDALLQAVADIISLIESRIAEILGDAQPAPILRAELRELIERIKEESK